MNPLLIRRRGMMAKESVPQDGQLEWIETDGVAYIDSGVNAMDNFAAEAEITAVGIGSGWYALMGTDTINGQDGSARFLPFIVNSNDLACFARWYFYSSGMRDISSAINNQTPYIQRSQLKSGSQLISTKLQGEGSFTTVTKVGTGPIATTNRMFIFAANRNGNPVEHAPQGTRIGYVTLWNNYNMGTVLHTFLPWRLNGEVGLMDTLTNTFYGNAAGSGAFIGGPNV